MLFGCHGLPIGRPAHRDCIWLGGGCIWLHRGCIWLHRGCIWLHRGCIWLHRGCIYSILQDMLYMAAGWLAGGGQGTRAHGSVVVKRLFPGAPGTRYYHLLLICRPTGLETGTWNLSTGGLIDCQLAPGTWNLSTGGLIDCQLAPASLILSAWWPLASRGRRIYS